MLIDFNSHSKLFRCSIWEPVIHVWSDLSITKVISNTNLKVPERLIELANQVHWQAIVPGVGNNLISIKKAKVLLMHVKDWSLPFLKLTGIASYSHSVTFGPLSSVHHWEPSTLNSTVIGRFQLQWFQLKNLLQQVQLDLPKVKLLWSALTRVLYSIYHQGGMT